jgi:hypothetical protein
MSSNEPTSDRSALYVPAMTTPFVLLALMLGAFACSPAPAPVSTSRNVPSSPAAPEGALPVNPAASGPSPRPGAPPAPEHDHARHDGSLATTSDGGTQGTVYVCPMHPEVTSSTAGLCPKCNMKLVPKK